MSMTDNKGIEYALNLKMRLALRWFVWFPGAHSSETSEHHTHYDWRFSWAAGLAVMFPHISSLSLLVDMYSWPGGVPGLHQPPFEGEAAEASRAAGTTRRQPQGHRPPPDQLQTKHHSFGQVFPGEGPYRHGKAGWIMGLCVFTWERKKDREMWWK